MAAKLTPQRTLYLNIAPILGSLALWEILARVGLLHPVFFPPPTEIAGYLFTGVTSGVLLSQLVASLRRILVAFLLGGSSGIVLGLWMGWSRPIRLLLNPYVSVLYPIPKVALVPILFAIFGLTETTRILLLSLAILLLVAVNTMGGVRQIDDVHIDAALDNGASTRVLYRHVLLPGALSEIFTGLSLGFGVGLSLLVVIEMIGANSGLGYVIWHSWRMFTIDRMYAALVMLNLLGIVFIFGLNRLGDYLTRWNPGGGMG